MYRGAALLFSLDSSRLLRHDATHIFPARNMQCLSGLLSAIVVPDGNEAQRGARKCESNPTRNEGIGSNSKRASASGRGPRAQEKASHAECRVRRVLANYMDRLRDIQIIEALRLI